MVSGHLLREARLRAGLSQAELAERTGKRQSAIARWESGRVEPSLETLLALIRACGLDLSYSLATYDPSYRADVRRRLALKPGQRVERALGQARAAERLRPALKEQER